MLEVQAVIGRTYALANLGRHSAEGFDLCATTHCQLFEPLTRDAHRAGPRQVLEAARQHCRHGAVVRGRARDGPLSRGLRRSYEPGRRRMGRRGTALPRVDRRRRRRQKTHMRLGTTKPRGPRCSPRSTRTRGPGSAPGSTGSRCSIATAPGAPSASRFTGRKNASSAAKLCARCLQRRLAHGPSRARGSTVKRDGSKLVFEGRGFGHGVGLCQAGALARVRAGEKLPAILQRYYPGTKLTTMRPPSRTVLP